MVVSAVMVIKELIKEIKETAEAARREGQYVCIDTRLPWIQVCRGENDMRFFQGHEAQQLLDEVPEWVSAEDYLLWSTQGES